VTPETLLAAALRDEIAPWPTAASSDFEADFFHSAADHGVTELLSITAALRDWPRTVQAAVLRRRRDAAAAEIIQRESHAEVLDTLNESGVKALLLKGAALAYTHYPQPWLRPRLDIDLLVAPDDRTRAVTTLQGLGYHPATHFAGELVTYQSQLRRVDRHGLIDRLDLHWRTANPQVFAHTFAFDELKREAVPVPQLGTNAWTLCPVHSLLLACIHRVAHHANSDRLVWLYDIRLIVDAMSHTALERAADEAASKKVHAVVAAGVRRTLEMVGSGVHNSAVERALETRRGDSEVGGEFLRKDRAKVDDLLADLHALSGLGPRLRLIREHLVPPPAYMRTTYGFSSPVLLPFAYALRAVKGAGKWFRADS
jgi:hypothetical protein